MKKCPNCNAEVENNYDVCWSCQYSFGDHKVLSKSDFKLICPGCNTETSSSFRYCTHCKFDLKDVLKDMGIKLPGLKNIDCLRCKVPMEYQGNFSFHEGTRYGAMGNMFELLVNRASFDLYHCPECGKVEFFLP
jgi:hypothetical protein